MKKYIKKLLPLFFYEWYTNGDYYKYKKMHAKDIFRDIYEKNLWGSAESISGTGSELIQTKHLILELNKLIDDYNINSILDLPCGDFNWMKHVKFKNINYIGADIVEKLVENNNLKYSNNDNIIFKNIDIIEDSLPHVDLIIVRDCFIHFSFKDIYKAIKNIKDSNSKYLLSTSFVDCLTNEDIITGSYRKLNLLKPPFSFPEPILVINEKCSEGDDLNLDKSMLLWEIEKIQLPLTLE